VGRRPAYHLSVAVNLSARSLLDADLVDDLAPRYSQCQAVEASKLVLEITETSVMSDAEYAMQVLNRLSSMGITLAMDDFGTGYSSLSYLKRLPSTRSRSTSPSSSTCSTTKTTPSSSVRSSTWPQNLGLRVVAEGVETTSTWDALRDMGCDIAQGYVISRPLPADQFDAWLETVMPTPLKIAR